MKVLFNPLKSISYFKILFMGSIDVKMRTVLRDFFLFYELKKSNIQ